MGGGNAGRHPVDEGGWRAAEFRHRPVRTDPRHQELRAQTRTTEPTQTTTPAGDGRVGRDIGIHDKVRNLGAGSLNGACEFTSDDRPLGVLPFG
jgi:hypothetical protein